jgi:hypothetical protein
MVAIGAIATQKFGGHWWKMRRTIKFAQPCFFGVAIILPIVTQ